MAALHNDATLRRLELMAAALEEVVRLNREVIAEVMAEARKGPGETNGDGREEDGSGDAGGRDTGAT